MHCDLGLDGYIIIEEKNTDSFLYKVWLGAGLHRAWHHSFGGSSITIAARRKTKELR